MSSFALKVYYEDTDAGGVVYHANYLRFFERARSEWLLAKGLSHRDLREQANVVLVVTEVQLRFLRPARLEDDLCIHTQLLEHGRVRLVFSQELMRGSERLATLVTTVAAVQESSFKPARLPPFFIEALEKPLDVNPDD
jgi:acyl-CoA thioester hydrolase